MEVNTFNEAGEHDVTLKHKADKAMLWDSGMHPYDSREAADMHETQSKEISLDRTSYPLYVGTASRTDFSVWEDQGSSVVITADVNDSQYGINDIKWSISDEETAYFLSADKNKAEVKGKRTGYATVTAELPNGEKAYCSISVIDNAARLTTQRIEFNTEALNLSAGQNAELKARV